MAIYLVRLPNSAKNFSAFCAGGGHVGLCVFRLSAKLTPCQQRTLPFRQQAVNSLFLLRHARKLFGRFITYWRKRWYLLRLCSRIRCILQSTQVLFLKFLERSTSSPHLWQLSFIRSQNNTRVLSRIWSGRCWAASSRVRLLQVNTATGDSTGYSSVQVSIILWRYKKTR